MSGSFGEETVSHFTERTRQLWVLALLFFGFGDLLTTTVGLQFDRIVEVGPIAAYVINHGYAPLLVLKVFTILLCLGLWALTPRPHRVGVPLGLATLGILVTGWNVAILLSVLV